MKKIISALVTALLLTSAYSALPEYQGAQILARANINDGYNLPPMSFLNNTNPVINNRSEVSFRVMAVEGQNDQGIWVKTKDDEAGKIQYVAPEQRFITDPSLNDQGKIGFNLHDEGVTDGLFVLDSKTSKVTQVWEPNEEPIQYYTYPQILNNDHIFFRATDDLDDRSFVEFNGTKLNKLMIEGTEAQGLKSSYLFRPSVNQNGVLAFKARLGNKGSWDETNPDIIALLVPSTEVKGQDHKLVIIARDKDADPSSPYTRFNNSLSLANDGAVAFVATLQNGKKALVLARDNELKNLAVESQAEISEIELFSPKINAAGTVAFRAKDKSGARGIYLADSSGVKRLIGEGSEIETDLGKGRILSNPNYPGLGGDIDMNDQGEIVFYCVLVDLEGRELGSAVYKLAPKK